MICPVGNKHLRIGYSLLAAMLACCAAGVFAAEPAAAPAVEAITKPSDDVTLSFVRAGLLAKVLVKEGQSVKAGEVLVQQDDTAEQAQLDELKAQALDTTRVRASQAELEQKKVDLKKLEDASKRGAATALEVEHARLDVTIADLSVELAKFQHAQDQKKYEQLRLQVERMKIVSPIDGKVEKLHLQKGESAEALAKVIRVVKVDPLWIDVPVPLSQAQGLANGQAAKVTFPGSAGPAEGKVIHVAAVADAASETLNVRVEIPNPAARTAGERVQVVLPPAAASPKS